MGSQVARSKAADGPLSAIEGKHELQVLLQEQVEAAIGAVIVLGGAGEFIAIFEPGCGVIDGGDIGQIAVIGGVHHWSQDVQAMD